MTNVCLKGDNELSVFLNKNYSTFVLFLLQFLENMKITWHIFVCEICFYFYKKISNTCSTCNTHWNALSFSFKKSQCMALLFQTTTRYSNKLQYVYLRFSAPNMYSMRQKRGKTRDCDYEIHYFGVRAWSETCKHISFQNTSGLTLACVRRLPASNV